MIPRRDPLAHAGPLVERLCRYVAYRLGDGPDAEDVTSDAFERALRYRNTYDPRRGSPLAWLIGIAARCIADRPRPTAGWDGDEPDERVDPLDLAEDAALRLHVRTVLAGLSERDRELAALRYGADLTAREIGTLLDLRTNAVEVALHRLNARLRGELSDLDRDPDRMRIEIERKGLNAPAGI